MIDSINEMMKPMKNEVEARLFEMLTSVGFKYDEDIPMNLIEQVVEFTEGNNISIKQEKIDNDMYYTLSKNGEKVCYFYTHTDYFVRCGDMKYTGKIFVSDIMFYPKRRNTPPST